MKLPKENVCGIDIESLDVYDIDELAEAAECLTIGISTTSGASSTSLSGGQPAPKRSIEPEDFVQRILPEWLKGLNPWWPQ